MKSEIWSVWVSNPRPYRYDLHALPNELADRSIQTKNRLSFLGNECTQTT